MSSVSTGGHEGGGIAQESVLAEFLESYHDLHPAKRRRLAGTPRIPRRYDLKANKGELSVIGGLPCGGPPPQAHECWASGNVAAGELAQQVSARSR